MRQACLPCVPDVNQQGIPGVNMGPRAVFACVLAPHQWQGAARVAWPSRRVPLQQQQPRGPAVGRPASMPAGVRAPPHHLPNTAMLADGTLMITVPLRR